jgi:hypothetical protein
VSFISLLISNILSVVGATTTLIVLWQDVVLSSLLKLALYFFFCHPVKVREVNRVEKQAFTHVTNQSASKPSPVVVPALEIEAKFNLSLNDKMVSETCHGQHYGSYDKLLASETWIHWSQVVHRLLWGSQKLALKFHDDEHFKKRVDDASR